MQKSYLVSSPLWCSFVVDDGPLIACRVVQGVGLRFEAEATGWLQNKNIPMTADAAKYENKDVTAKVLAILTPGKPTAPASTSCRHANCIGTVALERSARSSVTVMANGFCGFLSCTLVLSLFGSQGSVQLARQLLKGRPSCCRSAGSTFVESIEEAVKGANGSADGVPVGLVLDSTSFYAESGGQVCAGTGPWLPHGEELNE